MILPTKFDLPIHLDSEALEKVRSEYLGIISMGFGIGFRSHWTVWMAVREFVQNAFDITYEMYETRESLASVRLDYDPRADVGYIIDKGTGIKFRHLFLDEQKGVSPWERRCLRGKFGEGMKLAIIPLLREGHQIIIRTIGFDYTFGSVDMEGGEKNFSIIHMFRKRNDNKSGTCIAIKGVDPNVFRSNFIPYIQKEDPQRILLTIENDCKVRQILLNSPTETKLLGASKKLRRNAVSGGEAKKKRERRKKKVAKARLMKEAARLERRRARRMSGAGNLFVRDIFVTKMNSFYSYNFWFANPAKILDPDRNTIKENEFCKGLIRAEFKKLLYSIADEGRIVWKSIFGTMFRANLTPAQRRDNFEWKYLDKTEGGLSLAASQALFEVISEVVGTEKFTWSEHYGEGKVLEHLGYLDLKDKLPNFLPVLGKFIKSPDDLAEMRELKDKVAVITTDDFKFSKRASKLVKNIYKGLLYTLRYRYRLQGISLYLYTGNFQEEGKTISGFYRHHTKSIYLHAKGLLNPSRFIETFIHEAAHALCDGCKDITEEFENALAKSGRILSDKFYRTKGNLGFGDKLLRDLRTLSRILGRGKSFYNLLKIEALNEEDELEKRERQDAFIPLGWVLKPKSGGNLPDLIKRVNREYNRRKRTK